MKSQMFIPGITLLIMVACNTAEKRKPVEKPVHTRPKTVIQVPVTNPGDTCSLEMAMIRGGLIALEDSFPEIRTDLRYSTNRNFMGYDLYGCLEKTYALPQVARKLRDVQQYVETHYPGYGLLVFDCARPLRVQQAMWDTVDMPVSKKIKFLSNPALGSLHNYGAAVDLTLADSLGRELDMGTAYDDTSHLAWPEEEARWLENGRLTRRQVANRQMLRNAMYANGFFGIQSEWWHFNFCKREVAQANYRQIK